jgi:hypothetical protein
MSKNNRGTVRAAVKSPVTSEARPSAVTALGAPGYERDIQSELFLLAACNLPGEKAFHEDADERVRRFRHLVRETSAVSPDWAAGLLGWLRGPGNLRLAPVEAAAEFAWARRDEAGTGRDKGVTVFTRQVVNSVLQRGDEPGEIIAYWLARYGRKMPIGFKRGVADAVLRLYTDRALLSYDTPEAAVQFGDVVELVAPRYHGKEYGTWRDALYRYAVMRRHGRDITGSERDAAMMAALPTITAARKILAMPGQDRRAFLVSAGGAQAIADAGIKWEAVTGWLRGPMDAAAWSACIPAMGYMALIRNLRNFDQAGVPDEVAGNAARKLADPAEVARSRQFPFRFLSAYRAAQSLRWAYPLEKALNLSLANVPALPGKTLVLVDRSRPCGIRSSPPSQICRGRTLPRFSVPLSRCGQIRLTSQSSGATRSRWLSVAATRY